EYDCSRKTCGHSAVPAGLDQLQFVPGSELPGYFRFSLREINGNRDTRMSKLHAPRRGARTVLRSVATFLRPRLPRSLLKNPPGEGTGPTMRAEFRGNLVPSRGERHVVQQTASTVSGW